MDDYNNVLYSKRLYANSNNEDACIIDTEDELEYFNNSHEHDKLIMSSNNSSPAANGHHYHPTTHHPPNFHKTSRRSKRYNPWALFCALLLFCLLLMYIILINNVQIRQVEEYDVPIPGWEKNTTRDTTQYVLPSQNTTIIDPIHVCTEKLFLLVVVCSSSVNFEIRQSIRETWANLTEFNYSFFAKVHERMQGAYLDINFTNWKDYVVHKPAVSAAGSAVTTELILNDNNILPALNSSQQNFAVKIVFLIGQTQSNETQFRINNESESYGDVIQESFIDSYNNLTLKTIMMLKWVNVNCNDKVQFLMKCDDDTFVNVPNLLHTLLGGTIPVYNDTLQAYDQFTVRVKSEKNRLNQYTNLLLGSRFCNSKPIANISSKWYTPIYMYSGNTYPNYLSGTGYVMSMDVAKKLYKTALTTQLFHLEDVYLTGICAESAKIKPINHQLFSYTSYKKPCELKGMITKHELTASDMRKAYEFVTNTSAYCPPPDKLIHVRKVKTHLRYCN